MGKAEKTNHLPPLILISVDEVAAMASWTMDVGNGPAAVFCCKASAWFRKFLRDLVKTAPSLLYWPRVSFSEVTCGPSSLSSSRLLFHFRTCGFIFGFANLFCSFQLVARIVFVQIILQTEQSIMWCMWPAEQVYIDATLAKANIPYINFHSGSAASERSRMIHEFTHDMNPAKCWSRNIASTALD